MAENTPSAALPNNPFSLGPAAGTPPPTTGNEPTPPGTAGSNPFTMGTSEKSVMTTETTTQPQQQPQNQTPGGQPSPDLQGGVHMQNQGGTGPNQNPGFGPSAGGFTPGAQPQAGGNFNPAGAQPQAQPQAGGNFNPAGAQPQAQPQVGGNFNPAGAQPQAGGNFNPAGAQPQPQAQPQGRGNFNPAGGQPQFNPGGNGMFSGQNQNGNNFGGPSGGGNQPRYIIVDFFWWINKAILQQRSLQPNEASILTIGYNASFNNLRFSFHGSDQSTFSASSITMSNAPRLTNANIHSEQAIELLANKGTGKTIYSFERVIKAGNWSPNQTSITWNADNIIIQTTDTQGAQYQFTCFEEQLIGFEKALEFMINGQAWNISLQAIMNK